MSLKLFDLIHIDIWGAFHIHTTGGHKYFLTIVHDHTRTTWVYILCTKSEVLTIFPDFYTLILTQFNIKIKFVHSDIAPKLFFTDFFCSKGIMSYHSCVEKPEQNFVVEWGDTNTFSMWPVHCFSNLVFLYAIGVGDCILIVVHLINRTPSPLLSKKTYFELLTNKT